MEALGSLDDSGVPIQGPITVAAQGASIVPSSKGNHKGRHRVQPGPLMEGHCHFLNINYTLAKEGRYW